MSKLANAVRHPLDNLAYTLNSFSRKHHIDRVFEDWVEMCAYVVSNQVDPSHYDEREAAFLTVEKGYSKEERDRMAEMMAMLVRCLEHSFECPFQKLIQRLELGSASRKKRLGQFMTPFTISYMMAKMALAPRDKLRDEITRKGYLQFAEPACGAGGMVLAIAKALEDEGINFQQHLHVMAQDIDRLCVHMTYVSASLAGIPAIVMQGNTLSDQPPSQVWYTPFHVLGDWTGRRRLRATYEAMRGALDLISAPTGAPVSETAPEMADPPASSPEPLPVIRPGIINWTLFQDTPFGREPL